MKKPVLEDLSNIKANDTFSKTIDIVKAEQSEMLKKTFTLDKKTIDIINKTALKLGQEQGKVISASEAVRNIISQYKGV